MEPTLYDDQCYSCPVSVDQMSGESSSAPTPATLAGSDARKRPISPSVSDPSSPSLKELKSSLKLDFSAPKEPSKKQLLQTPELIQRFILASPDLEKFLTQGINAVATPTPTKLLYPANVTPAQRQYAQGFIDALSHIQQLNGFVPPTTNLLSPGFITPLVVPSAPTELKRSPLAAQTVASTSSSSPAVVPSQVSVPSSVVLVQSPTRATATDPIQVASSMIMQTMSNHFSHPNFGLMPPQFAFGGPTSSSFDQSMMNSGVPGAMSTFNVKREQPVVIPNVLVDDRPPSQKDPGSYEFTALNPSVPTSIAPLAYPEPAASSFMDSNQPGPSRPSVVTSRSTAMPPPSRSTCRQDDHLVPNVTMPPPTSAYQMPNQFDMDSQDRLKLERKRARNRTAATKCRQRKMEKISYLETEVNDEKDRGAELKAEAETLRKEIAALQQALQTHRSRGCDVDGGKTVAATN
uniref:BZIP domain-containing protein n=1 Tax=Plectus sambesii TaxID=2011161 RepID=A0A914XK81_9BILA